MARRQRRIVIGGAPVRGAPAIGWQCHEHIAELGDAEAEGAVADIGIGFGLAPCRFDAGRDLGRKLAEQAAIVVQGKSWLGDTRLHRREQLRRALRSASDLIAGVGEIGDQCDDAGRHVEADGVSGAAGSAGIVRHQHGDPALTNAVCAGAAPMRQCDQPR